MKALIGNTVYHGTAEQIQQFREEYDTERERQRIWDAASRCVFELFTPEQRLELAVFCADTHWHASPNFPYPRWDDGYDPIVGDEYMAENRFNDVFAYARYHGHPLTKNIAGVSM